VKPIVKRPKVVDFIKIIKHDFIHYWSTDRNPIVIELNEQAEEISAITKNNTPLMNNANINLKTPLINRKPLILVGKSNRTLRKSPRLKKMKENNESLI